MFDFSASKNSRLKEGIVYFNGAASLTSKNGGSGSLIFAENDVFNVKYKASFIKGETTNNLAEYDSLINALIMAIRGDNLLILQQQKGIYRVSQKYLIPFLLESEGNYIYNCVWTHVTRDMNQAADYLSKIALNEEQNYTNESQDTPKEIIEETLNYLQDDIQAFTYCS
ncbi:hypothetical protein THRCLA_21328 [Thraustotheca clavata]|uniref:RNase H type-1 domain-containing protein n=1 Tax=Thraustotheca clavata TaxID=74557 RepID=A0A1V9ZXQ0_9STRA|nr:hypothetical protein THRCLA_21328 [Thraustotheca clavata]